MPTRRKTVTPRSQGASNSECAQVEPESLEREEPSEFCNKSVEETATTDDSLAVKEETINELPYNRPTHETVKTPTLLNSFSTTPTNGSGQKSNSIPKVTRRPRNVSRFSANKGV